MKELDQNSDNYTLLFRRISTVVYINRIIMLSLKKLSTYAMAFNGLYSLATNQTMRKLALYSLGSITYRPRKKSFILLFIINFLYALFEFIGILEIYGY